VLIVVIVLGIDLLMNIIDYNRMTMALSGNAVLMMLFWFMLIYNFLGLIISYRAYKIFKE
jgi:hypothetical protein